MSQGGAIPSSQILHRKRECSVTSRRHCTARDGKQLGEQKERTEEKGGLGASPNSAEESVGGEVLDDDAVEGPATEGEVGDTEHGMGAFFRGK